MNYTLLALIVIGLCIVGLQVTILLSRRSGKRLAKVAARQHPDQPLIREAKCHIKNFEYADGHTETRHSLCGGHGLAGLTDAIAQGFYPDAALVHVRSTSHQVDL